MNIIWFNSEVRFGYPLTCRSYGCEQKFIMIESCAMCPRMCGRLEPILILIIIKIRRIESEPSS